MALSPLQCMCCHLEGDNRTSKGGYEKKRWWRPLLALQLSHSDQYNSWRLLTVAVPLDPGLVALQHRVNDDRAAQTHGLTFSSKRYTKLIHDVSLESDAILRHGPIYRGIMSRYRGA